MESMSVQTKKQLLSDLRLGTRKTLDENDSVWWFVLDHLPEELTSDRDARSAENAIYTALVTYATGKENHVEECGSVGKATKKAILPEIKNIKSDDERQKKENSNYLLDMMKHVLRARNYVELTNELNRLVDCIARENIAIDYIELAEDIYNLQSEFTEPKSWARMKWAEDYYRYAREEIDRESGKAAKKAEKGKRK